MSDDLVNIEIDGQPYQARKGAMLIEVTDAEGIHVPRFCYHKKLSVAANCRMCLVEVEKVPKPLPACATPVADGMKVHTRSALALDAQRSVMEFLLINHPLDCPICDQGGECELQDVAMGFGRDISRFNERKRVVKDKNIGPLVSTDMTRCIHCTRCVRFGEEIAGLRELGATGRGELMEIGTFVEHSLRSELSGNVIDLCPVGALNSKPYRFSARAWEMTQHRGVSPHDCVGSNLFLHALRGRIKRVVPRDNEAVNETWLADRDRYGYLGLYTADRLEAPRVKEEGKWRTVDWETALETTVRGIRRVLERHGPGQLGALAAPGATVEEHYLLQRLLRALGSQNVDHRLYQGDFRGQDEAPAFPGLGLPLAELEQADAVLIVGSHLRQEAPLINHRIRKAALGGARVAAINPVDYDLNYPLAEALTVPPAAMAASLAGVAKALSVDAAGAQGLGARLKGVRAGEAQKRVAAILAEASRPVVLLGGLALAHPDLAGLRALAAAVAGKSGGRLGYIAPGNAAGAHLAGALPHREAGARPVDAPGLDARAMFEQGLKGYVLLGVEPERDAWDPDRARQALGRAELTVAVTAYASAELEAHADVLLPMSLYPETSGTLVNAEGRWQAFPGAVAPVGEARPAWKILRVLGNGLDAPGFDYASSEEVLAEARAACEEVVLDTLAAADPGPAPESAPESAGDALERIGETPIYAVDALVRRAEPLQQTEDALAAEGQVWLAPKAARALGVAADDVVVVRQGEAAAELRVALSERVAEGAALVYRATAATAALGPAFGPITVEKR